MARVLVVDDDPGYRAAIRRMLELQGHSVAEAADGRLGARACRRERFDVVLVDLYMPERDGIELIIDLRACCPEVPVVAMTGDPRPGPRRTARALGVRAFLDKPFGETELSEALGRALGAG